jgi:hypothetical protein
LRLAAELLPLKATPPLSKDIASIEAVDKQKLLRISLFDYASRWRYHGREEKATTMVMPRGSLTRKEPAKFQAKSSMMEALKKDPSPHVSRCRW